MAGISLTAPDAAVPYLDEMAKDLLPRVGVDPSTLTQAQRIRRLVCELVRRDYRAWRRRAAQDASAAALESELAAGETEAQGIV